MKTKTIELYEFSELSKDAQQYAVEQNAYTQEYFWNNDSIKSLEKFAEHFNCEVKDYEIDWLNPSQSSVRFDVPEYVQDWTEKELKQAINGMGSYNKKTLKGNGDCKFTGFCMDEDAADGARIDFYKNGERDIKELLLSGFRSWHHACTKDYEYQLSHAGYADHCEANEIEFTKDGKIA